MAVFINHFLEKGGRDPEVIPCTLLQMLTEPYEAETDPFNVLRVLALVLN